MIFFENVVIQFLVAKALIAEMVALLENLQIYYDEHLRVLVALLINIISRAYIRKCNYLDEALPRIIRPNNSISSRIIS